MPDSNQKILEKLINMEGDVRNNTIINAVVKETVGKILNSVNDDNIQLKVNNLRVDQKRDNKNIAEQKDVRNKGQIWANDLRADLQLIDKKTGQVIDKVDNMKIADIPKLTDRGTFLIGGIEYQFTKQARLKPGVYTKHQANGEISSFFNVDKTVDFERGFNNNFKLGFDPENKSFMMTYGTKNVPLINALRSVGVENKEMEKAWGKDVFEANAAAYDKRQEINQNKLYEAIFGRQPAEGLHPLEVSQQIKSRLFATELDPQVTKITLGKPYKEVNKDAILDASKKIIDIHKGVAEDDDRESLIFKSFHDVEDHIKEKLIKGAASVINNIRYKLNKNRSINKSLSSQTFNSSIVGTITNSQLSSPPSQTNPMAIIGESNKYTILGEGGIGNMNAVTNEARQISNSEMSFMDPLHTPEGSNIGIAIHSAMDTAKVGNDIYSKFIDKHGKSVVLKPLDVYDKNIAFPDQYDTKGDKPKPLSDKIKVIRAGKLIEVNKGDVDYIVPNAVGMFDTSANSVPFLDSLQGNRGLTASKMQEQALSLKHRDKPLFKIIDDKGRSISEGLAGIMALPKSNVDGVVKRVTDDKIVIQDADGKNHEHQLYNNFSLNSESYLHNESKVKAGDTVKRGDVLADNNFTKDGQVALGANLNVAYVPFRGYNYEDSAIMSESAAKKLTSQHMYDLKAKKTSKGIFSTNKFKAYYPEELKSHNAKKLDSDGVIKPGQTVEHGDIVIAHLERKAPTADDIVIGRLDKQLKRDMADNAVRWENDHVGVVTDVKKSGNSVVVNIKTEEPMKVADKISGLHGNKHIISKIVPDDEMPYNPETGEKIELTMSPIGVSNRINTSQILESAAGKIAKKTGKQYEIQNFARVDNSRKIMDDLKAVGLSDKDILVDPSTNKPMKNPVANGIAHILKLEHKVDHKYSARYKDGYDANEQPITGGETGGKNLGRMEMGALLARGANENIREMMSIKGQRNDEYWKAMETGQSLPPPKKAFVWDKMLAMMNGSGINVEQKGKTFTLKPFTDDDILKKSQGEITKPTETYRLKDLAPLKDGLFDPAKAGGIFGEHYTHFRLPEKVLNPITASAAATLVDLPLTRLEEIINGKKFVEKTTGKIVPPGTPGSISGSLAVELLLGSINVKEELKQSKDRLSETSNPTEINRLNKKVKYLVALEKEGKKPTDYLISNVLVIPSKYRPVFAMGGEGAVIMSDINNLYQQTAQTANSLKDLKTQLIKSVPDEDVINLNLAGARGQLYQDLKVVTGLQEPTSFLNKVRDKKGFIAQIDGGKKQTKEGFFQDKVLDRHQDLVGRSTIILNPNLGGDEMGIPRKMAEKIFQPFVMKKLVSWGYKPLEAQKHIADKTSVANRALDVVADERLVIANRAPSLHRWNMTAFKPKLTDGKSIEVPAVVVTKNFGGDFDGDCAFSSLYISLKINELQKLIDHDEKLSIFNEFYFDSVEKKEYINSYLNQRRVNMPSLNRLVGKGRDDVYHIHISEFPRLENSKVVKENGNEEYDVPDGISIFTIDNQTKEFVEIPVKKFSIHKNLVNYTIDLSSGDTLWLSSDQSAIALNKSTFELEKVTPEELPGKAIPKVRSMDVQENLTSIPLIDFSKADSAYGKEKINCKQNMSLNEINGWLIGALIGNGWVSITNERNDICLASSSPENIKLFDSAINDLMEKPIGMYSISGVHEPFEGVPCQHSKHTKSSSALAKNFIPWIGSGAHNKHLPPFYLSAPEEFRYGLLSGLLDTDGTVCWLDKKNGTKQFNMQYSTMSDRLAEEMITLCRSLGITASISFGNKTINGIEKKVVISTTTAHKKPLNLRHEEKKINFQEFCNTPKTNSSVAARLDLVPFSDELFIICKEFIHHVRNKNQYRAINDSKRQNWMMSRWSAKQVIELDVNNKLPKKWIDIVKNENVTWVYVKELNLNPTRITMYDITAPGPYTFMLANGIIVFDTFQVHVPISNKALAEAEKMKPSASMLKTGYDDVLNKPANDMIVGSWLVSKGVGGKDTELKFSSIEQAREAFKSNKIDHSDMIQIDGIKAPYGMHEINSSIPNESKRWDVELNAKNVEDWIKSVTKKHNGKIGLGLADKIKEIGNQYVSDFGFTLGVSDTLVDKDMRDKLIGEAEKSSKKSNPLSVIKSYYEAVVKGRKELEDKYSDNTMVGIGIKSGGSKGIDNTSAITFMPGIVMDSNDKPIPIPITKSYSEGLDTFGYWTASQGARTGSIKKSISTSKPGWMTKDLMNSLYETRIKSDEPVDTKGVEYNISDKKGITNRFLARDVKDSGGKIIAKRNELVDSDLVNRLNQHKIKSLFVQSPLTDPTPGDGFSSWSYGVDYDKKRMNIGDNVGIMAAHTITEPSTNMVLKAFHTGGAMGSKGKATGSVFDQLWNTLKFTKNQTDKATLASMDGHVKDVNKSSIGGWDVVLENQDKKDVRYIHPNNDLLVKRGDKVNAGDMLSTGFPSPHDILKYKGMPETQRFLVDKLFDINDKKLDKREIETMVRGITNTTKIMDPGTHPNFIKGDIAPLTTVEHYNEHNKKEVDIENSLGDFLAEDVGRYKKFTKIDKKVIDRIGDSGTKRVIVFKDLIQHEPFLTPTGIQAKARSSEDWIARLAHNRIADVLEEGTTRGMRSDITPTSNPLTKYVTGEY